MVARIVWLIAEIGACHGGSLDRALMLSNLAIQNGADVVKFQKRNPLISTPPHLANMPHPNPHFAYGNTYLEHRMKLELSIEDHLKIKKFIEKNNGKYSCSVWDIDSAKEILSIDPEFIKIPSACNMNDNLLEYCFSKAKCPIHISLGMTSLNERNSIIEKYQNNNCVFYHTTSEYPCSFENLFLLEIKNLYNMDVCVGFSNHGYGIAADIAAIALGASFIERHFIDDRAFRHTDAAASLEPSGLRTLKRDIVNVCKAMSFRKYCCTEEEALQSNKLRNNNK